MSQTLNAAIAVVGIDIGKNSFHIGAWCHCVASSRAGGASLLNARRFRR